MNETLKSIIDEDKSVLTLVKYLIKDKPILDTDDIDLFIKYLLKDPIENMKTMINYIDKFDRYEPEFLYLYKLHLLMLKIDLYKTMLYDKIVEYAVKKGELKWS